MTDRREVWLGDGGPPMTLRAEEIRILAALAGQSDPVEPKQLRGHCCPTNGYITKLFRYGLVSREPVPSWTPQPKRVNYRYAITDKGVQTLKHVNGYVQMTGRALDRLGEREPVDG